MTENNFWLPDIRPLRRFAISRPIRLDPESTEKYPHYKTTIYEISGVRKKWAEQVNSWPPGDFALGEIGLNIIKALIEEGYKGKVEVRIPFYTAHNVLNYVMPRHKEPTKLYHAFYEPFDLGQKLARENGIDYIEYNDYPPEHNAKTYHPKFARAKRGQEPKLEKKPPVDNMPEEPPKSKKKNKALMDKITAMIKEQTKQK